jgi:hypothetical protein
MMKQKAPGTSVPSAPRSVVTRSFAALTRTAG